MTGKQLARLTLVLFAALVQSGCGPVGQLGEEPADTPSPSALPLSTATSPTTPTQTGAAQPTLGAESSTPTPTPVTSEPIVESMPTVIVPPAEPIALPTGFGISVFAQGLQEPRMMALSPDGQLYVAERGADRVIRLPDQDGDGVSDNVEMVAGRLNGPSSIAFFEDNSLYVGEPKRVLRLSAPDEDGVFQEREVIVDDLPGGGHSTRTLLFSSDWETLFVSVGSSCNVCIEEDERRAAIMVYGADGSGERIYARGLRNAVGITFRPATGELWATNNGRDGLGDDQPPETIYLVHQGGDAGWPRCHSGRVIDPQFGGPGDCEDVLSPAVEMQAHSAPLGLSFYTGDQFPETHRGDLFVAFHGSWNRTVPTGYKLVHIPMEDGKPGPVADFATGWLRADGSQWGRPVDVLTGPDGSLFVSDDGGGIIYRIFYAGE